jgi:hypothetical protein
MRESKCLILHKNYIAMTGFEHGLLTFKMRESNCLIVRKKKIAKPGFETGLLTWLFASGELAGN